MAEQFVMNFSPVLCSPFPIFLQRQHDNTLRELKALQQSRTQLEQHVDALVMEREMIRKQLNAARQARPEEIKVGWLAVGRDLLVCGLFSCQTGAARGDQDRGSWLEGVPCGLLTLRRNQRSG